jgi:hypothetical protein
MTNEQIYKYADKKLKKRENKVLLEYVGLACLGGLGILLMAQPLELGYRSASSGFLAGGICVLFFGLLVAMGYALENRWYKKRRNYIYNLVRADERKRCMTERYEHEGSK